MAADLTPWKPQNRPQIELHGNRKARLSIGYSPGAFHVLHMVSSTTLNDLGPVFSQGRDSQLRPAAGRLYCRSDSLPFQQASFFSFVDVIEDATRSRTTPPAIWTELVLNGSPSTVHRRLSLKKSPPNSCPALATP